MKHKFSRKVRYIPEWNDNRTLPEAEQVVVEIQPLKVADLLSLVDALGGVGVAGNADALKSADISRVVTSCGHLLPQYVTIERLEDDDGPVTASDIITYPTYLGLATELLMQCASVSMPSESAEGNSARPQG